MRRIKFGLKLISLSIMAGLCLMVLGVPATHGAWLELVIVLKNATGAVDLLLVLEVPALSVEIDCTGFSVKQGEILGENHPNGSNVAHAEILYTGCAAYSTSPHLLEQGPCELYESAQDREKSVNEGNILAKFLASVLLHADGEGYVSVEGSMEAGQVFARMWSKNCVGVPNGIKVSGNVVFDLHEGGYNVKHLLQVADLSLFSNELKYGTNSASLLGSVWVELVSKNPWTIC